MTTIFLVGAKSKQQPLESVPDELSRLKQLFNAAPNIDLSIEYEPYLTRSILSDQLRRLTDQVGILHFAGHSNEAQLQTDDELVYAQHIADILKTWEKKPCLVFLNGCNSDGQIELFLNAGVACVIATHNYIDDGQAALFAYEFYANLLVDPDKNTFQQAFDRAGSLTLMGESRSARSFDIDDSKDDQKMQTGWDWGLFTKDSELSTNWTYAKLQEGCGETVTPTASMDFITKAKLEGLQTRWQRLYQRHSAIEEQSDRETRAEERLRMKHILEQNRAELNNVEKEIKDLHSYVYRL